MDIGGDTAELSYLVRMANDALDYSGKIPSTVVVDDKTRSKHNYGLADPR
jgi:hypothetical protein